MNLTMNEHLKISQNPDKYKNKIIRACGNSKEIKKQIEKNFNDNIITDPINIYNKDISMRNFYTLPNTGIINDQKGFGKWLYGNGAPCKQNRRCL